MVSEADLLREGLPVAEAVSKRVARRLGRLAELEDLVGIAKLALYDVIRSYNPARAAFAGYASAKLKWALFDEVRRQTHGRSEAARVNAVMASERFSEAFDAEVAPRGEPPSAEDWQGRLAAMLEGHAAALAVGLCQSSVDVMRVPDASVNPEDEAARREIAALLRRSIEALPHKERTLVERHYYDGEPFDVIAASLGISKSWASRLHERAITSLGRSLVQRR